MKRPNHRVVMCLRRDRILHLTAPKVVACLACWVSGKNVSITKYVMSDDMDDIQDPRYHMRRRTFFYPVRGFACTWVALRARNPSPSERSTLNPQSTCRGPRPGPEVGCGVRAGSRRATETRSRGKTRGRKRKKCRWAKKTHLYIYFV